METLHPEPEKVGGENKNAKNHSCVSVPQNQKKKLIVIVNEGLLTRKYWKNILESKILGQVFRILRKVYIFRMYILKVFRQHCLSIPSCKIRESLFPHLCHSCQDEKEPPRKFENLWNFLVTSVTFVTKFTTPSKNIFEQSLLHLWHLWQKRSRNSISHLFVPRAPPALCFAAFSGRAGSRTQWFRAEPEAFEKKRCVAVTIGRKLY